MIQRGQLHWVDLGPAVASRPAKRRPVLVIQGDAFTASRLATVTVAVVTSKTALAAMPGNVFLPAVVTGLPRDSVVNVTALVTVSRDELSEPVGAVPVGLMNDVDRGLGRVLGLGLQ